jgi:hypothetical protein
MLLKEFIKAILLESSNYANILSNQFENDIKSLMKQPEYQTLDAFVEYKFEDEQESYDAKELQALARNIDYSQRKLKNALPPESLVTSIKNELQTYGLRFIPREKTQSTRGVTSGFHGTSPYAGFVGGGTGMGTGREGPMGFGIGGGPGAIGSEEKWDINDKKNLSMGASRKR